MHWVHLRESVGDRVGSGADGMVRRDWTEERGGGWKAEQALGEARVGDTNRSRAHVRREQRPPIH